MLLIRQLARLGVTPNTLTVIGLLLSIVTAVVIAQGSLFAGGLLVLFAGIFDMFDGAMARVRNIASTFGAFFDSTLDRYSESIILLGLLFYTLQRPGLHDAFWPFAYEQLWMITAIERIVYVWRITAQTVPTNVGTPHMETQVAKNEHNNHTYASDALVKVNTKDMNQSQQVSS